MDQVLENHAFNPFLTIIPVVSTYLCGNISLRDTDEFLVVGFFSIGSNLPQ